MSSQTSIDFMMFRGGSSKGVYFNAQDLPSDAAERDAILLAVMGDDESQIDGLGGANPLTSKVALVSPSTKHDCDIDYLFCQVVVGEGRVDTTPNCGNILSGAGPFAIESGLVPANGDETTVIVNMLNSDKRCEVVIQTPGGVVDYAGSTSISGVPGTAAPIECNYFDLAGSACGELLPTGNVIDVVDDVEVTCIDNGMPVVALRATDLGVSGYETPSELDANNVLKERLESIRLQIGPKMNLGEVDGAAVPKMCLISPAQNGGVVSTRTFLPYRCHEAIGVLGAVSVATACLLPGSVVNAITKFINADNGRYVMPIEHPSGDFSCVLNAGVRNEKLQVSSVGLMRTARLLCRGQVFLLNKPKHP